jgi:hypothetical protein
MINDIVKQIVIIMSTSEKIPCDQTFCEKCAQLCRHIAQNGAVKNKNFFPKIFLKNSPHLKLVSLS